MLQFANLISFFFLLSAQACEIKACVSAASSILGACANRCFKGCLGLMYAVIENSFLPAILDTLRPEYVLKILIVMYHLLVYAACAAPVRMQIFPMCNTWQILRPFCHSKHFGALV